MGRPTSATTTPVGSASAAARALRQKDQEANGSTTQGDDRPSSMASMATTIDESRSSSPANGTMTLAEYAAAAGKASQGDLSAALGGVSQVVQQKLSKAIAGLAAQPRPTLTELAASVGTVSAGDLGTALQGLPASEQTKLLTAIQSFYVQQAATASDEDLEAALAGVAANEREKLLTALGACAAVPQGGAATKDAGKTQTLASYAAASTSASASEVQSAFEGLASASQKRLLDALDTLEEKPSRASPELESIPQGNPAGSAVESSIKGSPGIGASTFCAAFLGTAVRDATTTELTVVLGGLSPQLQTKVWDALAKLDA